MVRKMKQNPLGMPEPFVEMDLSKTGIYLNNFSFGGKYDITLEKL